MGINIIQDFGKWNMDKHGAIALQSRQLTFDRSWIQTARKNWKVVTALLRDHLRLDNMVSGPLDLAIPRQTRQTNAENQIRDLVNICGFPPSRATNGKTWASDGSMTPTSASMMDGKTITVLQLGPEHLSCGSRGVTSQFSTGNN